MLEYMKKLMQDQQHPCTPEQQAGPHSRRCPICKRWTIHQYSGEAMCGCSSQRT